MGEYSELCGRKIFKGVAEANDHMYIKLDDNVYDFYNDPDDGYRSYGCMQGIANPDDYKDLMFNLEHTPLEVDVEEIDESRRDTVFGECFKGIQIYGSEGLESRTGEPICRVGTDYSDDYYPCSVSQFDSKEATLVHKLQFEYIAEKLLLDKKS
jgi:hypothetical protein